jgi:hypothetical protein
MSIWEFGITHPLWARPAELFSRLSASARIVTRDDRRDKESYKPRKDRDAQPI